MVLFEDIGPVVDNCLELSRQLFFLCDPVASGNRMFRVLRRVEWKKPAGAADGSRIAVWSVSPTGGEEYSLSEAGGDPSAFFISSRFR